MRYTNYPSWGPQPGRHIILNKSEIKRRCCYYNIKMHIYRHTDLNSWPSMSRSTRLSIKNVHVHSFLEIHRWRWLYTRAFYSTQNLTVFKSFLITHGRTYIQLIACMVQLGFDARLLVLLLLCNIHWNYNLILSSAYLNKAWHMQC